MNKLTIAAALGAVLALSGAANAQQSGHAGHTAAPATSGAASDAAYMAAHHKMVQAMDIKPTGNADRDFAAMMIPHHQGAIDMAKVELQYGKDPAMRKLAEAVIAAQEREIRALEAFLAQSK